MNSNSQVKFGSVIYDRLNTVQMNSVDRQTAINAMRDADAIVDAILWVTNKVEQFCASLFLKPGVKTN
jgi:hypothetical protein